MRTTTTIPSRRSVLAAGAAVFAAAGCSSNSTPHLASTPVSSAIEKPQITVAVVPAVTNLGLFVAQQRGWFAAEGLHLTIQSVTSSTTAIASQQHGSVDITAGAYVAYIEAQASSGGAIAWRVLAEGSISRPHSQEILVAANSKVSTLSGLSGKDVGVNITGNIATLLVDSALSAQRVSTTAVKQVAVPFPDMAASLERGDIAAGWFDEPFRSSAIAKIGAKPIFDTDQGSTQGFPLSGYMATKSWAERYPNTAAAFTRAIAKGQQLASSSQSADGSAMTKFLKGVTPAVASRVVVDSYPLGVDQTRLQRVADVMHQFGMISSPFDVSAMIA